MNLEYENRIRLQQRKEKLQEAGVQGNVDKLYSQISKAQSAIEKAQSACLDAADEMDAILVEATAIGGKIASIVPSHVKMHIAKLTEIAEKQLGPIGKGESASSLDKLQDLIGSIPYRDIRPQSAEDRRTGISMQPNLSAGPQSAIQTQESLEDYYRNVLKEDTEIPTSNTFSFDSLKESNVFGMQYETNMMEAVGMKLAAPIQTKQIREKLRVAADDAMFEDTDMEQLQEGKLDFNNVKAFGGKDGMPLKFDSLSDNGHLV